MHRTTVAWVLQNYKDGDEVGWEEEFKWLRENHLSELYQLARSMHVHGQVEPIRLGPDKRVWDGHHRLCVAHDFGYQHIVVQEANE